MGKLASIPASGVCTASIDFDGALGIVAAHARPLGKESVSLADAGGRRLAAPVVARIDSPRRDCGAMDGYADDAWPRLFGLLGNPGFLEDERIPPTSSGQPTRGFFTGK